ncbi:23057_t:CDS:2 [Dentiscutata erythropus]|uniref:23057_t:CDS:1 n=1 Tax=Dentiscutata erythropus TaxID=1348616 RepID=A0A9N9HYL0_9GLOM|nr:23057_t:CDS:2 [Dentiscutata erythropus]
MTSKDLTKPFFWGEDNIEGFLFDYEKYAKSKGWDEETQCGMIVMHMLEETKPWVRGQRINRLRNIKQGEKETVRGYASRYKAYLDLIKNSIREYEKRDWFLDGLWEPFRSKVTMFCPDTYMKTRDTVLQIENFQKDRERIEDKKYTFTIEERPQSGNTNVEGITAALEALTINCVKQETNDASRIDKLEENMKEIMKMFKQFIENQGTSERSNSRNQDTMRSQRQNSTGCQCFVRQGEGHMARNCPNSVAQGQIEQRNDQRKMKPENIDNRDINIHYFEIMDTSSNIGVECLKVEMVKGEPIFNTRNYHFRKRKCPNDDEEILEMTSSDQKEETEENKNTP